HMGASALFLGAHQTIGGTFFYPIAGTLNATLSAWDNIDRKNISKAEASWLRKLKLATSMFLLSLNIATGAKNISADLDYVWKAKNNFCLQKEIDQVMENKLLILDDLENPFKEDSMITSSDAATNILMESFNLNPSIDEQDREIALNLRQYIKENPYLDYERLYDDFSSFGIIDTNLKNGDVGAHCYDDFILFYDRNNMTDEQYRYYLEHELVHKTGHLDCFTLNEGMTALIP
ncbi:MAG: hypothetical protein K2I72_00175, partial [Bacilli bacterium]|nr:hypothetical protein [Bacilli bacterium]